MYSYCVHPSMCLYFTLLQTNHPHMALGIETCFPDHPDIALNSPCGGVDSEGGGGSACCMLHYTVHVSMFQRDQIQSNSSAGLRRYSLCVECERSSSMLSLSYLPRLINNYEPSGIPIFIICEFGSKAKPTRCFMF